MRTEGSSSRSTTSAIWLNSDSFILVHTTRQYFWKIYIHTFTLSSPKCFQFWCFKIKNMYTFLSSSTYITTRSPHTSWFTHTLLAEEYLFWRSRYDISWVSLCFLRPNTSLSTLMSNRDVRETMLGSELKSLRIYSNGDLPWTVTDYLLVECSSTKEQLKCICWVTIWNKLPEEPRRMSVQQTIYGNNTSESWMDGNISAAFKRNMEWTCMNQIRLWEGCHGGILWIWWQKFGFYKVRNFLNFWLANSFLKRIRIW